MQVHFRGNRLIVLMLFVCSLTFLVSCRKHDGISSQADTSDSATENEIRAKWVWLPEDLGRWGPNLAVLASATSNYSDLAHPIEYAFDEDLGTYWAGSYLDFYPPGHPYRAHPYYFVLGGSQINLTWATPQKIGCVFINPADVFDFSQRNINGVLLHYFDSASSQWLPITPAYEGGNMYYYALEFPTTPPTTALRISLFAMNSPGCPRVTEISVHESFKSALTITEPANNSIHPASAPITFEAATAIHRWLGYISNITWVSSLDGPFATNVPLEPAPPPPFNSFDEPYPVSFASLSLGVHSITVQGVDYQGNPVISDPIIITVGQSAAKVKIKNLDAKPGEDPFAPSTAVSYRATKTRFQAVGYRADGTEIGPVSVNWSLQGGEVSPSSEPLRSGLLNLLGTLNSRIGNIDGAIAVNNKSQVTFYSFLPGSQTLIAATGAVSPASFSIRIKQPTVNINVKYSSGLTPHSPVNDIPVWIQAAKDILGTESIIVVKQFSPATEVPNQSFTPHLPDANGKFESGEYLFSNEDPPASPSFLNPIEVDEIANNYFVATDVISRQILEIFNPANRAPIPDVVNFFVSNAWFAVEFAGGNPKLGAGSGGTTFTPSFYCKRTTGQIPITSKADDGVIICNTFQDISSMPQEYRDSEEVTLAHELGHMLTLGHQTDPLNLMAPEASGGPGRILSKEQFKKILDYEKVIAPSSFYIVEE